jgi:hypothetical protein
VHMRGVDTEYHTQMLTVTQARMKPGEKKW